MKHVYLYLIVFLLIAGFVVGHFYNLRLRITNPLPKKSEIVLYDSLDNLVAFKEHHKWVILDDEGAVKVLEKEIYRLYKINNYVAFKYDSLLKIQNYEH
jgi:hypothetical protein